MRLVRLGDSSVSLAVTRPGAAVLRVEWSPYWRLAGGCVERAGEWARAIATRPGLLEMSIEFAPGRIFDGSRRCG
jgi:hypothetical protein